MIVVLKLLARRLSAAEFCADPGDELPCFFGGELVAERGHLAFPFKNFVRQLGIRFVQNLLVGRSFATLARRAMAARAVQGIEVRGIEHTDCGPIVSRCWIRNRGRRLAGKPCCRIGRGICRRSRRRLRGWFRGGLRSCGWGSRSTSLLSRRRRTWAAGEGQRYAPQEQQAGQSQKIVSSQGKSILSGSR